MPSYLRGQERDLLRFVRIKPDANLYYGFNTKDFASLSGYGITEAEITVLGQLTLGDVPQAGFVVFRANSPKPARVKKIINRNPTAEQIGNASTFVAGGQLRAASAEGWKLAADGRGISLSFDERTVTAIADLTDSEGLYASGMNRNDFDNFSETLGLSSKNDINTAAERARVFTGSSRPRPPIVRKKPSGSQGKFQSICSASALSDALSASGGFELRKAEVVFA